MVFCARHPCQFTRGYVQYGRYNWRSPCLRSHIARHIRNIFCSLMFPKLLGNERSNIEIYFAEVPTTYFCWELFFPKICFGCRYLFWRVSVFFQAVDGIFPVFHLDFPILRSWVLVVKNPGLSQQSQQSRVAMSLTKTSGSLTWSCRGPMVFLLPGKSVFKTPGNFFMGLPSGKLLT